MCFSGDGYGRRMESEELDLHLSELNLRSFASCKDDEIDKLKQLYDELMNKHSQLEETTAAEIAILQKQCEDLKIKHEEKEANIRTQENQHKELLVKAHDLEIHISCGSELDTCRKHADLNKQLEKLETSNQQHIATIAAASEDITRLNTQYNELWVASQQQEENISNKQGEIANLQMQNDALKRGNDDQEAIICDQKRQNAVLEDKLKELTNRAQEKEEMLQELRNRYQAQEANLDEIKIQFPALEAECDTLKMKHQTLEVEHTELRSKYKAQEAEFIDMQNKYLDQMTEYNELSNKYQSQEVNLHELFNRCQAEEAEHEDLNNRYRVLEVELDELKEKYQNHLDEYDVQVQRVEIQALLAELAALRNRYEAQDAGHKVPQNRFRNAEIQTHESINMRHA